MVRTPIKINIDEYPEVFAPYFKGAKTYDSSCSPFAKVVFIDKDNGFYLKTADKGSLKSEADMTTFFASKGLSKRVVEYVSADKDYMLTERVLGEDCTYYKYMEHPKKLCDTIATLLRQLHETNFDGCPIQNHTKLYFDTVDTNYKAGVFDSSYIDEALKHLNADEAYKYICERKDALENNVLLHGDYCLPNIMLDGFKFSGFIDVGNGGVGDRHIDLFWGAWTLNFNLKTDMYRDRFFDAYGRDLVDKKIIRLVSVIESFG